MARVWRSRYPGRAGPALLCSGTCLLGKGCALRGREPALRCSGSAGSWSSASLFWRGWKTEASFMRPSGSCLWPCDRVWATKFAEVRASPAQTDPAFLPGRTLSWMQRPAPLSPAEPLASQGAWVTSCHTLPPSGCYWVVK